MSLARKKKMLNIRNIETALMGMEIKLEEMEEEMDRKRASMAKQEELLEAAKAELGDEEG